MYYIDHELQARVEGKQIHFLLIWRLDVKIQIIGLPCNRLTELVKATHAAVQTLGFHYEFEEISDTAEVEKYGVPLTPVLIVDGKVRSMGRVQSQEALEALLKFIATHRSKS